MVSSYTLTAYGKDGISTIQKTINVQWMQGSLSSTTSFQLPSAIDVSPDGNSVYVAANGALNVLTASTLLASAGPLTLPNQASIQNVVATPDGSKLFLAALAFTGDGFIQAYTSTLSPLPISPPNPGLNDSPNLYPMAVSDDGSQLVISAAYPPGQNAQFIAGYDTSSLNLKPAVSGNPASLPSLRWIGLAVQGNNIYYPDQNGLGILDSTSFAPLPGSPVSLKSNDNVSYTPGPLAVSPDGNTVATLALGFISEKRVFILCSVDIPSMTLKKRGEVYTGFANAPVVSTTGMTFSLDGQILFVFGTDYSKTPPAINNTVLSVFDATSLQELPWSPVPVTKFYGDFVVAPDGSRIYVTTLDSGTASSGNVIELVPYLPQQ
jgi:DNA-binding beta-propeller fold protein YncE